MAPATAAKRAATSVPGIWVADAAPVGIGEPFAPVLVPVGLGVPVVPGVPVVGVPVVPLGKLAVTLVGRTVWVTDTVPVFVWGTSGGETRRNSSTRVLNARVVNYLPPWQRTLCACPRAGSESGQAPVIQAVTSEVKGSL